MLAVLADRIMATGDDIIIKGTVLSKDRDHGAQRQDDRERARNVAKLRLGDAIGSGPQIYLAGYKLQSGSRSPRARPARTLRRRRRSLARSLDRARAVWRWR